MATLPSYPICSRREHLSYRDAIARLRRSVTGLCAGLTHISAISAPGRNKAWRIRAGQRLDPQRLTGLCEQMLRIRRCEKRVHDSFLEGKMPEFVHLCSGQEVVAAGVGPLLKHDAAITTTHHTPPIPVPFAPTLEDEYIPAASNVVATVCSVVGEPGRQSGDRSIG